MAVRQTGCRYCGLDVENFWPYRKGEWRDRGNNTHCNDGKHQHAPYIEHTATRTAMMHYIRVRKVAS